MKIETCANGPFMVNSYMITNNKDAVIIDPGADVRQFISTIDNNDIKLKAIISTHGHIDHIQGVNILKQKYKAPFYMNSKDTDLLKGVSSQANMFGIKDPGKITVDRELPSSGDLKLIGLNFELYHTPGHSKGSVSIKVGDTVFPGDTLFNSSIGRTDLPGGNMKDLINSIKKKLLIMPDSTKVLPGHGPGTTIGRERKGNPFLK